MVPIFKYTVECLPNFVRKLNSQGLECSQSEARLVAFLMEENMNRPGLESSVLVCNSFLLILLSRSVYTYHYSLTCTKITYIV